MRDPGYEKLRTEMNAGFERLMHAITNSSPVDTHKLLTTDEVAKQFKVSKREVLRWKEAGLKAVKLGKGFKFKRDDVERFVERLQQA